MMLYHVVAMAKNRVIGKDNKLPWHFSSDMKHFKQLTTGSTVIMGRKTYESIGRPLPNRENFILTRKLPHPENASNLFWFNVIDDAIKSVKTDKAFIIGGAELYAQTLDKVDGIYLTIIDQEFEGDAYYPELPRHFQKKSQSELQDNPKISVLYYEASPKEIA